MVGFGAEEPVKQCSSRRLALLAAASALIGASPASTPDVSAQAAVTPAGLAATIRFLASDGLEGRGPATAGDKIAEAYLASRLEALGFSPGGPGGSWLQSFEMIGVRTTMPATWRFDTRGAAVELSNGTDFIATAGQTLEDVGLQGSELVFAGYGIRAPELGWDDFASAPPLAGKTLVVLDGEPDWHASPGEALAERHYYGRWQYKYQVGASLGAAAVILVQPLANGKPSWSRSWTGEVFQPAASGDVAVRLRARLTDAAARRLFAAAGADFDTLASASRRAPSPPVSLGIRTSVAARATLRRVVTANVIGQLAGRDPSLKHEAVIVSAHHDHLGVLDPDETGDRVYNGALDNAAGVAQVLGVAEAFAKARTRPRRSILVVLFAAEEQGLLGAYHYVAHPTVPLRNIAGVLNYDGGNIWGRASDVRIAGFGLTTLDGPLSVAAGRQGRVLKSPAYPDRGDFFRSDQYAFERADVPAIRFTSSVDFIGKAAGWGRVQVERWEAEHYHRPSDQIDDKWNFDGMVDDARLGFIAAWAIAEQPVRAMIRPLPSTGQPNHKK